MNTGQDIDAGGLHFVHDRLSSVASKPRNRISLRQHHCVTLGTALARQEEFGGDVAGTHNERALGLRRKLEKPSLVMANSARADWAPWSRPPVAIRMCLALGAHAHRIRRLKARPTADDLNAGAFEVSKITVQPLHIRVARGAFTDAQSKST